MTRQDKTARPSRIPSWLSWLLWIGGAFLVAFLVMFAVFRIRNVVGQSMEPTLRPGDLVIVNELGRSTSNLFGRTYVPKRGELVVFKNPFYNQGDPDAYLVKRVIGLPGDRIVVRDGRIVAYPASDQSKGFNPDESITGPQGPTSGSVDRIVPEKEIFVVGDNRQGNNSLDSRNGMSTVPVSQLEGNAILRLWPLTKIRLL